MNKEIERKWRLPDGFDPVSLPDITRPGAFIVQYYLSTTENEIRLRRRVDGGEPACYLTVKAGDGLERDEWETEIPEKVFTALQGNAVGSAIRKVRYELLHGGRTLEIDVYDGILKGLVVMECEFPDAQAAKDFVLPPWADSARDVTEHRSFKNRSLAIHPEDIGILAS